MILVLIAVITGAAFLLLVNALWAKARPSKGSLLLTSAAIALIAGLGLLAATGRLHWLAALGAAIFPFLRRGLGLLRWAPFLRGFGPAAGGALGGTFAGRAAPDASEVATAELKMTLDHDSGEMDGKALAGAFAGRPFSTLAEGELRALRDSLREQDSVRLFDSYLERRFGEAVDDDGATGPRAREADGPMTPSQAREILGLEAGASEQDVVDAHRRLIQKLHPDRGGTSFLAAQLNEAKRVLLGR